MLLFTLAENCPVAVSRFVKVDKDEHDRLAVIKCCLNLFHNVLNVSYDTILKLEWTDLVPTEVYDMMNSLESKLQWNIDSKLLGCKCSSSKKHIVTKPMHFIQSYTSALIRDLSKYGYLHLTQSLSLSNGKKIKSDFTAIAVKS